MNAINVNSNCPEFGYELLSAVPYAYNLYLKGQLGETISAFDTTCLYFFSPKHTESNCKRSWDNMGKLWNTNFPNINIHRPNLDWNLFSPPPFKEYYKKTAIKFDKETLVIFNRYNKEWGQNPINYLDLDTLEKLFTLLEDRYQVVYINLNKGEKYFDGANPLMLNDESILKKHPKILSLYDVMDKFPEVSLNEIQLRMFANCSKYISSNGGQLILSAYFGGENIIFSKKCRELDPNVNSFYKWYNKLGDGVFQHVDNYENLIELVTQKWVENKPLINILIRTSGRPNYFESCMSSIYSQSYKNWNVIVSIDDKESIKYTQKHKCLDIEVNYKNFKIPIPPNNQDYGIGFIYNLYLNDLQDKVKDGYVVYLDDDDCLSNTDSLKKLVNEIKTNDDIVFWRVGFPNRLVPSDENFGKEPIIKDISGIGFCFHIKNKKIWEPYKRGDYRIAKQLYNQIPNKIFINQVITKLQREKEDGFGKKDDLYTFQNTLKSSIILSTHNNVNFIDESLDSIIKSIKNLDCEILVGIDGCEKTLNYIKNKKFDYRIKFFYFDKNSGPYVVKNTLCKISKSENIIFFDSDDIMKENMVSLLLSELSSNDFVKPMYCDFTDGKKIPEVSKTNKYGEGVFAIRRKLFLEMNGFEPWRCAADSDFMGRLYKNNKKFSFTDDVVFYRRVHPNSLTQNPETCSWSKLRAHYYKLSKNKKTFGPLPTFSTESFVEIYTDKSFFSDKGVFEEVINKKTSIINKAMNNINLNKKKPEDIPKKEINYDVINQVVQNKGVYIPKKNIPIRENKPNDRNKLIELKKGENNKQIKELFKSKPSRRNNLPNIF